MYLTRVKKTIGSLAVLGIVSAGGFIVSNGITTLAVPTVTTSVAAASWAAAGSSEDPRCQRGQTQYCKKTPTSPGGSSCPPGQTQYCAIKPQ